MKRKSRKQEPKSIPGKIWDFLWKDDSLASWLVSLVLAFVIVKFIFFPLLSLIFATSMPLVVVESGSMHHPGSFVGNTIGLQENFELWWKGRGEWYESIGIEKKEAERWHLKTGLEQGDIVVVSGYDKKLKIGDIIIFNANQKHPLIHRIVEVKEINGQTYYETKGDNNLGQLIGEKEISENAIIGRALLRVPKLGWIKLAFVKLIDIFS